MFVLQASEQELIDECLTIPAAEAYVSQAYVLRFSFHLCFPHCEKVPQEEPVALSI